MTPAERARKIIDQTYGCTGIKSRDELGVAIAQAIYDALAESAPKWSKEPPTVAGWYWSRGVVSFSGERPVLVRCSRPPWIDPERQDLYWYYADGSGGEDIVRGEWSGPLERPQ